MWEYEQTSGKLYQDGVLRGTGYSGFGSDKNRPIDENIKNEGPIPEGFYVIGDAEDTKDHGPVVLPLISDPKNKMFGRAGFLIHGDSKEHPGEASHGCIIMPRSARELVAKSDDRQLTVVSGIQPVPGVEESIV